MARHSSSGPTSGRYVHFSGPYRDADEESDVVFDYNYYDDYSNYRHGRDTVPREFRRAEPSPPGHDAGDKILRDRRGNRKSSRAAVSSTTGTTTGATVGSHMAERKRDRNRTPRDIQKTRSIPTPSAIAATRGPVPKYTTPQGRPQLSNSWTPVFSNAYGRWYYVNKSTGRTQWEAPGFELSRDRGATLDKGHRQVPQSRSIHGKSHGKSHVNNRDRIGASSITGILLGAAGGIAAGTLAAKAMEKKRLSARSDQVGPRWRSRQRGKETRNDKDDFEEDNVPGHHHSHDDDSHNSARGHSPDHDDDDDYDDDDD
ncbi:hypothetical protein SEPCBS119000_004275 [Sporothrix epigloea]|uniref:WW domain-containing protein n=1 Tax=Sporothrix epigloea TaxID=1892477 RepID=A0ABP0DR72_9PEZI